MHDIWNLHETFWLIFLFVENHYNIDIILILCHKIYNDLHIIKMKNLHDDYTCMSQWKITKLNNIYYLIRDINPRCGTSCTCEKFSFVDIYKHLLIYFAQSRKRSDLSRYKLKDMKWWSETWSKIYNNVICT